LPMPRAAPVTRAVLPVNNPILILFMLENTLISLGKGTNLL